jgi:hypothetical protein
MTKRLKYALMTTMTAGALVLGLSGTAYADSPWVYTTDAAPGGKAKFFSNGVANSDLEEVRVCDLEADGQAAWVAVWDMDAAPAPTRVMYVHAGSKGTCATDSDNIPEGHHVSMDVSLSEGFNAGWDGRA